MKSGCGCMFWMLIAGVACCWGGGQALYVYFTNSEPVVVKAAEYAEKKPDADWLKLEAAQLRMLDSSYFSRFGTEDDNPDEIYVPVANATDASGDILVLLASKQKEMTDRYAELVQISKQGEAAIIANASKLVMNQDIDGLVRSGIDLDDKERRQLEKSYDNLSEDFIIIDHKSEPSFLTGLLLIPGLLLFGFVLLMFFSKDEEAAPEEGQGTPPPPMPQQ